VKVAPITPKPQTTRKGVRGIYSHEHAQIVFVDTPGMHQGRTALDEFMAREIRAALADVEAVLWVVDLRRPPNDEDKSVARLLQGIDPDIPVYLIGNKVDAAKYPDEALDLYQDLHPGIDHVRVLSALNDPETVYTLRDELLDLAEEGPFFFPAEVRSDQSRSEWTAELIREAVMIHLRQELPYSVAVRVVEWDESSTEDEPHYVAAEIWVERSNHRGMVIGKGGKMIKEIGQTARKQLEVFLAHQVFLDLEVVVRSEWRSDLEALRELGYES
jgi:GTP-binding protein Era